MRWAYLTFFVLVLNYGYSNAAPSDSSKNTSHHANVQVVINLADANETAISEVMESLHNKSVNYIGAVMNGTATNLTSISVLFKNENISVTLNVSEVTSVLQKIENTSSPLNFDSLNTTLNQYDGAKLILVDVCMNKSATTEKFFTEFQANIRGFYVNMSDQAFNATSDSFFSSLEISGTLASNESYIFSFADTSDLNATDYLKLRQKLCRGTRTWKERKHNSTQSPSTTNLTTQSPSTNLTTTQSPSTNLTTTLSPCWNASGNASKDCANTTLNATMITTTPIPTTTHNGTNIREVIANHSGSASVALAIVVVLLILIITGLVFRRKIIHYVRFKMLRPGTIDLDQPSTVRYRGLHDEDF